MDFIEHCLAITRPMKLLGCMPQLRVYNTSLPSGLLPEKNFVFCQNCQIEATLITFVSKMLNSFLALLAQNVYYWSQFTFFRFFEFFSFLKIFAAAHYE